MTPPQSKLWRWRFWIGSIITNATSAMAKIPIGSVTKKTQRHDSSSVRYPPRNGPSTADVANTIE